MDLEKRSSLSGSNAFLFLFFWLFSLLPVCVLLGTAQLYMQRKSPGSVTTSMKPLLYQHCMSELCALQPAHDVWLLLSFLHLSSKLGLPQPGRSFFFFFYPLPLSAIIFCPLVSEKCMLASVHLYRENVFPIFQLVSCPPALAPTAPRRNISCSLDDCTPSLTWSD